MQKGFTNFFQLFQIAKHLVKELALQQCKEGKFWNMFTSLFLLIFCSIWLLAISACSSYLFVIMFIYCSYATSGPFQSYVCVIFLIYLCEYTQIWDTERLSLYRQQNCTLFDSMIDQRRFLCITLPCGNCSVSSFTLIFMFNPNLFILKIHFHFLYLL